MGHIQRDRVNGLHRSRGNAAHTSAICLFRSASHSHESCITRCGCRDTCTSVEPARNEDSVAGTIDSRSCVYDSVIERARAGFIGLCSQAAPVLKHALAAHIATVDTSKAITPASTMDSIIAVEPIANLFNTTAHNHHLACAWHSRCFATQCRHRILALNIVYISDAHCLWRRQPAQLSGAVGHLAPTFAVSRLHQYSDMTCPPFACSSSAHRVCLLATAAAVTDIHCRRPPRQNTSL